MDRGVLWVPDDCILLSCEPKGLRLCWQRPRVCSWHWVIRTRMAPCCTTWKRIVALFHVFPMFSIESWHALFAPGEDKLSSRLVTFKKLYRVILSIKRIMWEIIFVEGRTLWCNVCFNFLIVFFAKKPTKAQKFWNKDSNIFAVLLFERLFWSLNEKIICCSLTFPYRHLRNTDTAPYGFPNLKNLHHICHTNLQSY